MPGFSIRPNYCAFLADLHKGPSSLSSQKMAVSLGANVVLTCKSYHARLPDTNSIKF